MVSSITQLGRIGYYREITSANRSVFYHGSITAIYALRILAFPITQRNLADAGGNVLVGSCKPKLRRYHDEYSTIVKNRVSIAALFGIISISITGFSFPVPAMYPPFQLLSNIFPLRHYFLIYVDQALNGIPLYYSRMHYLYLFLFAIASLPLLKRLKTALQNQVYVP